jgi:hypothetical protein
VILRGTAVSAVAGALVAALAACSSAGIPAATTSSMSASVTQTAPSVWSAPDTVSTSAPGASSTAGTDGSSGTSTLPGLTEACSVAIRAQLVINDLFSDALQGGTTSTGTAAPATVSTAAASGISAAKVADVFGEITPSIPAPLSSALATLHDAANSIVGKPVTDIPAVLNSTDVTDAMNAFGSYIAACEPRATD